MAADPAENPCEGAGCRAHACTLALRRRLEQRLDELAWHLTDADALRLARTLRDALREEAE